MNSRTREEQTQTQVSTSLPKKKKKENVKINDFESEFCTAKTAFNEKSLIQL